MQQGMQPPECVLDSCHRPPVAIGDYCEAHSRWYAQQNGTAIGPPIIEPDDPALLEKERRRAEQAEAQEYAERRRVKTWRTLENGTRVPEESYSDDELAELDAQAAADVAAMTRMLAEDRKASGFANETFRLVEESYRHVPHPEDPTKAQAKLFRKALKGKLGSPAQAVAEAAISAIEAMQNTTPPVP